jgi:hypothetical protein
MTLPSWSSAAVSLLLVIFPTSVPTAPPVTRPAQIILIRHAEKPADPDNPHLSPAGVRRAEQLVSFIRTNPALTKFGLPVAVFATRTTKDGNGQRTQETVAPLATALRLPVLTPFRGKDYAAMAKRVLGDARYDGRTVLICWNHEQIPQLAASLGVRPTPPKWKSSVYDLVYVISYQGGEASLATFRYDVQDQ